MPKDEKKIGNAQAEGPLLKEILTENELAGYLKISVYTVRKMRQKEGLPTLKFDNMRAILYYRPAVEDWLRSRSLPWTGTGDDADTTGEEEKDREGRGLKYNAMAPIPD